VGVYTRGGDGGQTSRLGGERTSKASAVIEANGALDELSTFLAAARAAAAEEPLPGSGWTDVGTLLLEVQRDLILLGAALSSGDGERWPVPLEKVPRFEALMDAIQETAGPLRHFLVPGADEADARLHQARAVCRRAERRVVALQPGAPADQAVQYLNRFADVLFILSVWHRFRAGIPGGRDY